MPLQLLVVNADRLYLEELVYSLESDNYEMTTATTIKQALQECRSKSFSLAIIDMEYEDGTGLDLKKEMNEIVDIPTIVVTELDEDIQKVLALEYGADDYMVKPFNILELKARIRAVLRRYQACAPVPEEEGDKESSIVLDDFEFNIIGRKVQYKGTDIGLTGKEFDLFYVLMSNKDKVFSRKELANKVWDEEETAHMRTVDVHIRRLREKLEPYEADSLIKTKWGIGYYYGELDDE